MHLLLIIAIVLLIFVGCGYFPEKIKWNNGYCPHCGSRWKQFDTDSQGGRGYMCSNRCAATASTSIWISYPFID